MADKKTSNQAKNSEFEDLITLRVAAIISGLSQDYLANLIRSGTLWGTKLGGRNWFTSKEEILNYLKQERRPGPKKPPSTNK